MKFFDDEDLELMPVTDLNKIESYSCKNKKKYIRCLLSTKARWKNSKSYQSWLPDARGEQERQAWGRQPAACPVLQGIVSIFYFFSNYSPRMLKWLR